MQLLIPIIIILISVLMTSLVLSLEDINQLIKHFAYHIQARIEDFTTRTGLFISYPQNHPPDEQSQKVCQILNKYSGYCSSDSLETKILKKFAQRVLQIFQFFKQKHSSSQNMLDVVESKIKLKLQFWLQKQTIPIGEVIRFVHSLTKSNALTTFTKHHSFQRQKILRPRKSSLRACSTSVKISAYSRPQEHEIVQRGENRTEMSIIQNAKSHYNFEPLKKKQSIIKKQGNHEIRERPFTSKQNRPLEKRSQSQDNATQCLKKYSISKKKGETYLRVMYKQNKVKIEQNTKKPVQLDKLYVGMHLDRKHIEKMLDRKEFMFKDMQRRNERILHKMRKQAKRQKLSTEQSELRQNVNQADHSEVVGQKLLTEQNSNLEPDSMMKKQSLRNMSYQTYLEKKKKVYMRNNRNISKKRLLHDKENLIGHQS